MSTSYSFSFKKASRSEFARQAALDAFGHRGRWALDEPDFIDRDPNCATRLIAKVGREAAAC